MQIPGFVDAHCHAFQRALRGRDRGGDFWAWRDGMIALAESLTVEEIRREYVEVYRELRANGFTAVGEFHYLGLDGGARGRRGGGRGRDRVRPALRLLPPRRHRRGSARSPSPSTSARSRRCAPTASASGSPPTPCARARPTRCASSARTPRRTTCRCTCTPTSSRARSRSASPRPACGRSSCSTTTGCLGPRTTVVHATHADGHELDLLAAAGCADLRLPDDRGEPRRRLPAGRARPAPRDRLCASAATRTCASTRSRSCASSRGSRAVRRGSAASSRSTRCSAPARAKARRHSVSTSGPTRPSTSRIRSCAASTRTALYDALVFGCSGDVLAEDVRPVARAREVRRLGRDAVQAPRAVVREVAVARAPSRDRGGLDLRSFVPFVERRDRDVVRAARDRSAPHRVVGLPVLARLDDRVAAAAARVVPRADRRRAEQVHRVRLGAEPVERCCRRT